MKKLLEKDKKIRKRIKSSEKKRFILKTIFRNFGFINLIRFNALSSINNLPNTDSKTFILNRCVFTSNKKRLNKLTNFSRIVFRKLAKKSEISGIYKSAR